MNYELIIIGAGPAGMAAAIEADAQGLSCILLDEQPRSGGQIYRNVGRQALTRVDILGPEYQAGLPLLRAFEASACERISGATVWQISSDAEVFYSVAGRSSSAKGKKVLIATGAQERPMPIPGWTLPGVMTAGAAQILLKSPGLAAEGAVFAGSGPLLLLVVWQYLQAGVAVKAVLDTTPRVNYYKAIRHWRGALTGYRNLVKGLKLLRDIKAAGVPFYSQVSQIEAIADADQQLERVRFNDGKGEQQIESPHLFLHQGVIPQVNLALASGCEHRWNEQQLCWMPVVDDWCQSSQPSVLISGDGMGIGGAVAAALRGKLAVLQVANVLGQLSDTQRDQRSLALRRSLNRELAFRPFIDTLYRPADSFRKPVDEQTVICRCEEVRLADIKDAVKQGCMGPNQLKSFTRCGMGPCQGRQCGNTVTELMADLSGKSAQESGYYRLRAPVKPLNLSELATLNDEH